VADLLRELLHLGGVLRVHRHADDDDARMLLLEGGDLGDFLDAGHAPRRPEVDHHPAPLVIGQPVAVALRVGHVESGGGQRRNQERRHGEP